MKVTKLKALLLTVLLLPFFCDLAAAVTNNNVDEYIKYIESDTARFDRQFSYDFSRVDYSGGKKNKVWTISGSTIPDPAQSNANHFSYKNLRVITGTYETNFSNNDFCSVKDTHVFRAFPPAPNNNQWRLIATRAKPYVTNVKVNGSDLIRWQDYTSSSTPYFSKSGLSLELIGELDAGNDVAMYADDDWGIKNVRVFLDGSAQTVTATPLGPEMDTLSFTVNQPTGLYPLTFDFYRSYSGVEIHSVVDEYNVYYNAIVHGNGYFHNGAARPETFYLYIDDISPEAPAITERDTPFTSASSKKYYGPEAATTGGNSAIDFDITPGVDNDSGLDRTVVILWYLFNDSGTIKMRLLDDSGSWHTIASLADYDEGTMRLAVNRGSSPFSIDIPTSALISATQATSATPFVLTACTYDKVGNNTSFATLFYFDQTPPPAATLSGVTAGEITRNNKTITVTGAADEANGSGIALTEMKITGGDWQEVSQLTFNAEGSFEVKYRLTDNVGNQFYSDPVSFTIDRTSPEGHSITVNGVTGHYNNTVPTHYTNSANLNISLDPGYDPEPASDPHPTQDDASGVNSTAPYRTRYNKGRFGPSAYIPTAGTEYHNSNSFTYTLPSANGTYTIHLAVRDKAENALIVDLDDARPKVNVVYDSVTPTLTGLTISDPDKNVGYTDGFDLAVSYSTADATPSSGLQPDQYRWDRTGGWTAMPANRMILSTPSAQGLHTLEVRAVDQASNSVTVEATIIKDTDAPTGTISLNSGAAFTRSTAISAALTGTDSISGVAYYMVTGEALSNPDTTWQSGTPPASVNKTLNTGDGAKTVYLSLKDRAGNIASFTDYITLDQTAPGIDPTTGTASLTNNRTIAVKVEASDYESRLTAFRIKGTGVTAVQTFSVSPVASTIDLTKTATLTAGDGTKYISIEVEDVAGNVSTKELSVTLDQTGPDISLSSLDYPSLTWESSIIVRGLGIPTDVDHLYLIDAAGTRREFFDHSTWALNVTLPSNATSNYSLEAVDAANNQTIVTGISITHDAFVDKPTPTLTGTPQYYDSANRLLYLKTAPTDAELSLTLPSDDLSGLATIFWKKSASVNPPSGKTDFTGSAAVGTTLTLNLNSNDKYLYFWLEDLAGNNGAESNNIAALHWELDTTPPDLIFSTSRVREDGVDKLNINLRTSIDTQSGIAESSGTLIVTDPAGTSGPRSPDHTQVIMGDEGTYSFTFSANDRLGNSSSTTEVFVVDTTPPSATVALASLSGDSTYSTSKVVQAVITTSDTNLKFRSSWEAAPSSTGTYSDLPTQNTMEVVIPGNVEGRHAYYLLLKDAAGNIANTSVSSEIFLDLNDPRFEFVLKNNDSFTSTTEVPINVKHLHDYEGSGISKYQLKWNVEPDANTDTWYDLPLPTSIRFPGGDGDYTLYIRVKDRAGRTTLSSDFITLYTTNQLPNPAYSPEPADGSQNFTPNNRQLAWRMDDPDTSRLRFDLYLGKDSVNNLQRIATNESSASVYNIYTLPAQLEENATYYWRVDVKDLYHDPVTGPVWSFNTADISAPTLTISEPASGTVTSAQLTVRGQASDNYQLSSLRAEAWLGTTLVDQQIVTDPTTLTSWNWQTQLNLTNIGIYTIKVWAADSTGNVSQMDSRIINRR